MQENAFERVVCSMAAIMLRPQCDNLNVGLDNLCVTVEASGATTIIKSIRFSSAP